MLLFKDFKSNEEFMKIMYHIKLLQEIFCQMIDIEQKGRQSSELAYGQHSIKEIENYVNKD